MKVLEIKNNLVKIAYDIDDNLALSGFVIIEDSNGPYVAQVVSLKADSAINTAIVKLLFTFDEEGVLKNYNGTIPSLKATVSKLPSHELLDVLPVETPIKLGALAQQNIPLLVDKSIFENNFVICCNKQENINTFINNILFQLDALNQKTVIIDVDGEFDYENKFEFGYDFKLPLNYTTLNYIFDHDLGDIDAKSKAVIQDIFYEVQEYSKTLPLGFIPFDTFLEVVDAQYRETQIPELILLKNKLLKYKEENIFALNSVELTDLTEEIKNNNVTVLNISKVDGDLQRQVISFIYDTMSEANALVYSVIKLNNYNASKKLIKRFLSSGNIATTVICGYEFKYLQELKQVAANFAFFAPLTTQHDFAAYNTYLNKLNPEEFVAFGDATQEIPLIVELAEFTQEDLLPKTYTEDENVLTEIPDFSQSTPDDDQEEMMQETPQEDSQEEELQEDTPVVEDEIDEDTYDVEEEVVLEQEEAEPILNEEPVFEEEPAVQEEQVEENIVQEEIPEVAPDYADDDIVETEFSEDETILPEVLPEENFNPVDEPEEDIIVTPLEQEEILVQEPEEPAEILEPETSYENANILQENPQEVDEEQIVRDVDDIFYNKKDVEENIPPLEDEEEITETDLDMIDNLHNPIQAAEGQETELNIAPVIIEDEEFEQEEQEEQEEQQEPEQPEIVEDDVPVYPANDIPQTSSEIFEAGDEVSHPKYGKGVVEKMIKYGNKVLCSINFENIGRRLLDPAISEITKI